MQQPIELLVSDLKLSQRFYRELFPWSVRQMDADSCEFCEDGQARLRLRRMSQRTERSLFEQERVELLILVQDIVAMQETLRAKRILFRIVHERKLEVIDPDQHLITVRDQRDAALGTQVSGARPAIRPNIIPE